MDADFETDRHQSIDQSLASVYKQYEEDRKKLKTKHKEELQDLSDYFKGSSLEEKKVELLKKQEMELSNLEQECNNQRMLTEKSVNADFEAKHAKMKLKLREKHYQVGLLLKH